MQSLYEIEYHKMFRNNGFNFCFYLTNKCKYDYQNSLIIIDEKQIPLTKRENVFIKLLLVKNAIVTYDEMDIYLTKENKEFSLNAKRAFVKNLRKKLPDNILKNIFDTGYKLDYSLRKTYV